MSNNEEKNQQKISPPILPLEEKGGINYYQITNNYYIDGNLYKAKSQKITMIDKSKHETTKTTVQAKKIEGSAIGKGNKATNINLDSFKTVFIILAVVMSLLLLVATITFIVSNGQTNLFPPLQDLLKNLLTNAD